MPKVGEIMYMLGIINSRRLGRSLGVDIVGADKIKRCNFSCVYCECGSGKIFTKRGVYADFDQVIKELKVEKEKNQFDCITFSGNGEPTLNSELGKYIKEFKKITEKPVVVITNSALISNLDTYNDLLLADIVMPSLDSAVMASFKKVDRPHGKIKLAEIISSLIKFSKEYQGILYLEVLLVKGYNDTANDLEELTKVLKQIKFKELHINSLDRLPAIELDYYTTEEKEQLINYFKDQGFNTKGY